MIHNQRATPHQRWRLHTDLRDEEYAQMDQESHQTTQTASIPPNTYTVLPNLLAGEYPAYRYDDTPTRLLAFLQIGVTWFIDLTEPNERSFSSRPVLSYEPLLNTLAEEHQLQIVYRRFAIRDRSTPSKAQMVQILNHIDTGINTGSKVYVHCLGGIGRTGTVIGCYLVQQGATPEDSLRVIARGLYHTYQAERLSPETDEQRAMVLQWQRSR